MREALPESLMEGKSAGILRGADCSHEQDKEEDLHYCRAEKSISQDMWLLVIIDICIYFFPELLWHYLEILLKIHKLPHTIFVF